MAQKKNRRTTTFVGSLFWSRARALQNNSLWCWHKNLGGRSIDGNHIEAAKTFTA